MVPAGLVFADQEDGCVCGCSRAAVAPRSSCVTHTCLFLKNRSSTCSSSARCSQLFCARNQTREKLDLVDRCPLRKMASFERASPPPRSSLRVLPGVGAVPVDRVPVGDEALVGHGGAESQQQAEQQQEQRPPGALHVRRRSALRPGKHPSRLSSANRAGAHPKRSRSGARRAHETL